MHLLAEIPLHLEPSPLLLPLAVMAAVGAAVLIDALTWLFGGMRRGEPRMMLAGTGLLVAGAGAVVGTFLLPVLVGVPTLCAAALWMAVRGYWRTTSPLRVWMKAGLLALRIAAVLLLLAFLARPILKFTHTDQEKTAVLILVDASKSMSVKDVPTVGPEGTIPRDQAVTDAIGHAAEAYQGLSARYDVYPYRFSQLRPAGGPKEGRTDVLAAQPMAEFSPVADGQHTDIGDAMFEAHQEHLAGKVAAVFVLTDGANNLTVSTSPEQAARMLAARGVRLYLVPFGSPKPLAGLKDIVIRNLEVAPKVAAFNSAPVKVRLDMIGLADRDVDVELQMDGQPIPDKRQTISAARDQETAGVEFDVTPTEPGFHKLTVVAHPPLGAKLASDNNHMSAYVQVVDEGIRVLYVGGRFRWETKYLSKSLATYSDIRFQRRIFFKPPGVKDDVALPESPEAWARFHVVIFGDVPRDKMTDQELADLRDAVDTLGTGFLMIGGYHSFGAGGYAGTPVADLLPVQIRPSDGQIDRALAVRPAAEGLADKIMLLVPAEGKTPEIAARDNAAVWAKLPDVQGANQVGPLKPTATLLAEADDGTLILATAPYGKGRTAALTTDTTWQWYFNPAQEDTSEYHKRFWRQLVLWLANRKPSVWISADRGRYQLPLILAGTEKVGLIAGVTDADGKPIADATLDVQVIPAGGRPRQVAMVFSDKTGLYEPAEGQLIADADGDYEVKLAASQGGKAVGTSSARFLVYSPDIELANALADVESLKEMALAAGDLGKVVEPDHLAEAFDELQEANITHTRIRAEIVDIPDVFRWPLFAAVLALTTVEWALRKRKGLV